MKKQMERSLLWAAMAAIYAYRTVLRPLNLWGCKFQPSCSQYALEALRLHGTARGLRLALGRLLRCRPGTFGGVDPVPEADAFDENSFDESRAEESFSAESHHTGGHVPAQRGQAA